MFEGTPPEDPPDHRRALKERLPRRREMVDPGCNQSLEGVGDAIRCAVAGSALDEHTDRLLDKEWIALGPLERLLGERRRHLARCARELREKLLDEQLALFLGERLELDRRRTDASSTPPRPRLEQLGTGETDDEERRAHEVREMLDQIEQRNLGPVDVFEEQDQRLDVRDALHYLACRPGDLLWAALALQRLHQPGGEAEHVCDGILCAALTELLERLLEGVVVRDARRRLDHLRERPIRDAFPIRQGATDEAARALDAVQELAGEPALPDTRLSVDREEMRAAVSKHPGERVLEKLELSFPAHEGSTRPQRSTRTLQRVDQPPRAKRRVHALQLERTGVLDHHASGGQTIRGWRPSSTTESRMARAARVARCASSSCACGTPNAARTASPANFSTIPPCWATQRETVSKNWFTRRRTTSGSAPVTRPVESTMSTNRTVASFRSMLEV